MGSEMCIRDSMRFAVFNFADICVCVGVALWVLVIFLGELHSGDAKEP